MTLKNMMTECEFMSALKSDKFWGMGAPPRDVTLM